MQSNYTDGVVTIRPYTLSDAETLTRLVHVSWKQTVQWMPWCHEAYTIADATEWISQQVERFERGEEYSFVTCKADTMEMVGGCGLNQIHGHDRSANLGYWTAVPFRGHEYSLRATRLLLRFAFTEVQLERVEIVVATRNRASLRVVKKLGAFREGKARNRIRIGDHYHDVHSVLASEFATTMNR